MKLALTIILCFLALGAEQAQEQSDPAARRIGDPVKFDEYGKVPVEDEEARLDNLAFRLNDGPNDVVYLYVYAGRRACIGEAEAAGIRAKNYLVRKHRIEPARITWKDAGHRKEFTIEMWVLPRRAAEPYPSPTVDRNYVKFRKCQPRKQARRGKS